MDYLSLKLAISSNVLFYHNILPFIFDSSVAVLTLIFGIRTVAIVFLDLDRRLLERRGLGAVFVLLWVAHHHRRVHGEWLLLEAEFSAMTEVDL